jgi:enoyl-CoA hydratase
MPFVSLERRDDGVALVRLDRPKMNALSTELLAELAEVARQLTADPPGAVVVWGGERIFAAGAEIAEFGGPDEAREIANRFHEALDLLAAIPRATVAAINGYALGGGCELSLACDFRIVAENARLGQPEILLGIIPGGGGTQRLPRLIGTSRAKKMVLTGVQIQADEALDWGLADLVVPADKVLEAALEFAGALASGPLQAIAAAKRAIDDGLNGNLEDGLSLEKELFAKVFETEDAVTGVKSFLEQGPGKATFAGR